MKKLILFIGFIVIIIFAFTYFLFPSTYSENILSVFNSKVQIIYDAIYLLIAVLVLWVANNQLGKTREATTIQTLTNISSTFTSDQFIKKRKQLANFILKKENSEIGGGIAILKNWLQNLETKEQLNNHEIQQITYLKNTFQIVIDEFETLAYYYKKRIFSIEDIYQLFSYDLQRYWILIEEIGFIHYLRFNKIDSEEDFYNKFENLFVDTLKQECINKASKFGKPFLKIYYWFNLYKIFYRLLKKFNRKGKIIKMQENKQTKILHFLNEEAYR